MKKAISYLLYPFLLLATVAIFVATIHFNWDMVLVFAWMGGIRFVVLLTVEFLFPCKDEWKMTRQSFVRDLKWMAVGATIFGGFKLALGMLAIDLSKFNTGLIANTSIFTEVLATMLIYEFFQYWYHRLSHEGKGAFGKWLWRVHVAHHLPDKVYLLMHPVFHPINMIVTLVIIQGSLILLGARPESIFLFNALMGLHGLVSHFNVDIKAGPLNYIFIGTELHRYHHSANVDEAKNYGSLLSIWDIVFGTFHYEPNKTPERLGVSDVNAYPKSNELMKVLALPFKHNFSAKEMEEPKLI